MSIKVDLKGKH